MNCAYHISKQDVNQAGSEGVIRLFLFLAMYCTYLRKSYDKSFMCIIIRCYVMCSKLRSFKIQSLGNVSILLSMKLPIHSSKFKVEKVHLRKIDENEYGFKLLPVLQLNGAASGVRPPHQGSVVQAVGGTQSFRRIDPPHPL